MKCNYLFKHIRFRFLPGFICLLSVYISPAQNLLTNGDFESGGAGTGFQTNYNLTAGPSSVQKNYAITNNPGNINSAFSNTCVDHTTGSGHMMVVDGSSSSGDKIWEAMPTGGIAVQNGITYTFSYWIQAVSSSTINLADIQVKINNVALTPTVGSTICPTTLCTWTKVSYTWTANSSYAQIWLFDLQTGAIGNDFALDDISFLPPVQPLSISAGVVDPSCPDNTDGAIIAVAAGGIAPYRYSLNGGPFQSDNIFRGLGNSNNNQVTAIDASTPPDTIRTLANIAVTAPTNPLVTGNDTLINTGGTAQLFAGGVNGGYLWTSTPSDPSLTNPGIANPSVQPTVTTVYTIAATNTSTQNLLLNPGFENGNTGFTSDYQYYTSTYNYKSYGIVADPYLYDTFFIHSADHSGVGNMMVVDGSDQNNGNDKVWCQSVPVKPNTGYTFSYWIQTIATPSPAQIEATINGNPITGNINTSTYTTSATPSGWILVSYSWNSGSDTLANICLFDKNTVGIGNDFALDDLSFIQTNVCTLTKQVFVQVNHPAPVTLLHFTADWKTARQEEGLVYWQTSAEINSRFFEVQRSLDGIHYITIATIPAAGNSNTLLNYSTNDIYPSTVVNSLFYYRLKLIDLDGRYSYSAVASIRRNVYNPSGPVSVSPTGNSIIVHQVKSFYLYDASGRKMKEVIHTGNALFEISTSHFAAGMYFYEALYENGEIYKGKFFLNKHQ